MRYLFTAVNAASASRMPSVLEPRRKPVALRHTARLEHFTLGRANTTPLSVDRPVSVVRSLGLTCCVAVEFWPAFPSVAPLHPHAHD